MSKAPPQSKQKRRELDDYTSLLADIKRRIGTAQVRAVSAANESLLRLYWEIGGLLIERQKEHGWGAAVLPRLAADIKKEFPALKGFSPRNMARMILFRKAYTTLEQVGPPTIRRTQQQEGEGEILPPVVAKLATGETDPSILPTALAKLPWAHNITLLQKVKDAQIRNWYAVQAVMQGWSRRILAHQIDCNLHERQGNAVSNFEATLPSSQSDLARDLLKDPYIFDFLTLEPAFRERDLEAGLLKHLQRFLIELGGGFAFVGSQVHLEVGGEDFYIDLLFYHLNLRCFVVIDLKMGGFKPEHAGKMNFYLNAVDEKMRHEDDRPCIGLILCQEKNRVVAEYSLQGIDKAIGVSAYELTRSLPKDLQSVLPTIEELEFELSGRQ